MDNSNSLLDDDAPTSLCCVLVGLPARGKTYTGRKITRYLSWQGVQCRHFNVGEYRRQRCGARLSHHFFDPGNREAEEQRLGAAMACLEDMVRWLCGDGGIGGAGDNGHDTDHDGSRPVLIQAMRVAVYDATNSTRARRQLISQRCSALGIRLLFIESICTDDAVILENVRQVKQDSPDYVGRSDVEAVVADFMARIEHYARVYEPLELDYNQGVQSTPPPASIQLIDLGRRYVIREVDGYWESRIALLLMNMHIRPRRILLCRHGESEFNLEGRIGGDSDLSSRGMEFARSLPSVVSGMLVGGEPLQVWTSSFKRTKQTASFLLYPRVELKALDEIDAGVCEGLTYEEIAHRYPLDFAARDRDKFRYRYRGGESYADLVGRLDPVIMDLERQEGATLIIAHQAVLRTLLAYYMDEGTPDALPYLRVPLHTVIELVPTAYGCRRREVAVGVECVDTHRIRPEQ